MEPVIEGGIEESSIWTRIMKLNEREIRQKASIVTSLWENFKGFEKKEKLGSNESLNANEHGSENEGVEENDEEGEEDVNTIEKKNQLTISGLGGVCIAISSTLTYRYENHLKIFTGNSLITFSKLSVGLILHPLVSNSLLFATEKFNKENETNESQTNSSHLLKILSSVLPLTASLPLWTKLLNENSITVFTTKVCFSFSFSFSFLFFSFSSFKN